MDQRVKEKNLISIIITILSIALIIAIAYNLSFLLKLPRQDKNQQGLLLLDPGEASDSDEEYQRIIQRSKSDYKSFMEQSRPRIKDLR